MDVVAFGVLDVADVSALIPPPHLEGVRHVAVILGVGVNEPGILHRLGELDQLGHRLARQHLGKDVFPGLQAAYAEGRVLGGVVRQHYGVHIVLEEAVEILVQSHV